MRLKINAKKAVLLISASLCVAQMTSAQTEFSYSGYIKLDTLVSRYDSGESGRLNRDFYIPGLIPVSGENDPEDSGTEFDMHARQSRFIFQTKTSLENGKSIGTKLEFDFQVLGLGDERISNSYVPRIRQAYITYDNFLFGQAWTTFMNLNALPDSVDFIGNTDGTLFNRQSMIRYSYKGFQVAIENPETTISNFQTGGRVVTDDNSVPDLVLRYNWNGDWGTLSASALVRQLACEDAGLGCDDSETSYGLTFGGKIRVGERDDIRFNLTTGTGLGRYFALNTANGAVFDQNGNLEAIDSSGYSIAYRHLWNDKWRSSFMYSAFNADNDVSLTGGGVTEKTHSIRANLMYSPVDKLSFGVELSHAERELENNADGSMDRFQFSVKYAF